MYIGVISSSSSCRATSTDIPDLLSIPVSIVYHPQFVFKASSCFGTELLYIGSCWSSCLYSSMWWGPLEYVTYEFVLASPTVSCISGSSDLDSFCDGWLVGVQLLFCGVLPPGLNQYCSQHSCVIAIYIYIYIRIYIYIHC